MANGITQNVTLPDIGTDAGALARLLIAESLNPGTGSYDPDEVKVGMNAMKAVVDNRLHNSPAQFGAPGASNYKDIIAAPNQFYGFTADSSGNVVISDNVQAVIDGAISIANTGAPGAYAKFVQNAIDVSNGSVSDPFNGLTSINGVAVTGGAFGWRTAGSSDPGGRLLAIPPVNGGILAGNQFYALMVSN